MRQALALALPALLWLSCQTNTVGGACTVDTNCDYGQTCYLPGSAGGFAGGFCTRGCTQPGAINECPGGTICTQDTGTSIFYCTFTCTVDTDCRDGYHCNPIPQSTQRGCGN